MKLVAQFKVTPKVKHTYLTMSNIDKSSLILSIHLVPTFQTYHEAQSTPISRSTKSNKAIEMNRILGE